MSRCPICRGRVDEMMCRCTRCDTDLRYLIMIEKSCHDHCHLAIQSMREGHVVQARVYASHALRLMRTPFTQALSQFAWEETYCA